MNETNRFVHYFTEETRIDVKASGRVDRRDVISIACGAKVGEADNRKRQVTCQDCRAEMRKK